MHSLARNKKGFTLIELMIVVVLVGILATVAYPSYQEYVRKTRRTEGQTALLQLMQQQERYFSQHNTYIAFSSTSDDADAMRFKWYSGNGAAQSAYEISGAACSDSAIGDCIELTAVPGTLKVDSHFTDSHCASLSLRSTGKKDAGAEDCWR